MISETTLSRGYSSFWLEYFPWLNAYSQSINKFNIEVIHEKLDFTESSEHRAINNTIAFHYFTSKIQNGNAQMTESKDSALKYLKRFPRNNIDSYKFDSNSKKIIEFQTSNLLKRYSQNGLIIKPFFPGCGILDNCYGDLIHNNTLVEIKAGDRSIAIIPSDLKQLIVYFALNWLSNDQKFTITQFEVYNPRLGYSWVNNVDDFFISVTDVPKEDICDQMAKYLVTQSEEIEL